MKILLNQVTKPHVLHSVLDQAALVSESDLFGTITYINDKFCTISQYSYEELLGKPHSIIRHPDTPKEIFKDLWKTIQAGKTYQNVIKNRAKDGSAYWVDVTISPVFNDDGKIEKYLGIRFDVTEEMRLNESYKEALAEVEEKNESLVTYQEKLQQSLEKLQVTQAKIHLQYDESERYRLELQARVNALNSAAIISESDVFGTITFVNDKFCELSQYKVSELLGKPHSIVRHPDMPREFFKKMWDTIKTGKTFQGIVKNKAKDGSPYWVEATIQPILDGNGNVKKYIGVRFDITKQIEAREKIADLLEKTEQAYEELKTSRVELVEKKLMSQSINYAKRIQEALLPSKERCLQSFSSAFVLYMPKDVVSGDFYWHHQTTRYNIIAAIDCTGHGVPGAFMSVMANSLLNSIIIEQGIYEPAQVLNILQRKVIITLRQAEPDGQLHDGMDISLCVIDKQENILLFAGANRPLYIVNQDELTEIKGDKIAIGGLINIDKKFTQYEQNLNRNEKFYIFSDGYCDQFGGEAIRRYGTPRLKTYLKSISHIPLGKHGDLLSENIVDWLGSQKQIDDIIMIGFQV